MNKMLSVAAAFALVAGAAVTAHARPYSFTGAAYSQNFDSLSNTGTTNAWANDTTITGWVAFGGSSGSNTIREATPTAVTNYRADFGDNNAGALRSHGASGSNERALASVASGSFESVIGFLVQNNAANDIDSFTFTFDGEQWRQGGNTATQKLEFDFIVMAIAPVDADWSATNVAGWTANSALDFTSPVVAPSGTTPAAIDGNTAGRVAGITATINVSVPVGHYLLLRWWDNNDPGNDHGLGLDNVSFSATTIPAPGSLALVGLAGLAAARRRR